MRARGAHEPHEGGTPAISPRARPLSRGRAEHVGWVERSEAHHAAGGPRTARPTRHSIRQAEPALHLGHVEPAFAPPPRPLSRGGERGESFDKDRWCAPKRVAHSPADSIAEIACRTTSRTERVGSGSFHANTGALASCHR